MAGIPKGPDAFFRLSPAEGENSHVFGIMRGEHEGRLDVSFYLPKHLELEHRLRSSRYTAHEVGSAIISKQVVDGPFGSDLKVSEYVPHGIPLIRVSNCRTGLIEPDDEMVYISEKKHAQLCRSEVLPGDVLLTKAGAILGYSAVFPEALVRGNITSHLASIRPAAGIVPRYLSEFLTSNAGNQQIYRWGNKSTRPELNTDEVRKLLVPVPPENLQKDLVAAMDEAQAQRRAKLAEADELLSGLDGYLLTTLGLTPPPKDERKVFAVSISALGSQARLNADYFHPERILALRALEHATQALACPRLEQVVDFIRGQIKAPGHNYLSLANVQSNTGELVPTDEEVAGACSVFQRGDVLFARLRPYLNKVHAAEKDGCCSPEFHVLRAKDSEALHPDYLAAILRSSLTLAQTRHMMTGNTHPRLTNEDVVNLVVPVPKPDVQESIATEARRRREEARRLRAEAEAGWQAAKRWFEEQLLGPVQP